DAVLDFLDAELDIFVHGGGDVGDRLAPARLVLVVGVAPDGRAKFQVHKLHIEIETGDYAAGTDFPESIEVAVQTEFRAGIAAERRDAPEMSRRAKSAGQGFLKQLRGRFNPAMIFVQTE